MQPQRHFHPVNACNDGVFNTRSGKTVNLRYPTEEMINIRDIAGALSNISRFGGHTSKFYSVAQHSVLVAAMAPENIKREALMHDAAEAYLGDVIKPLKVILAESYKTLEVIFEHVIAQHFLLYTDDWTHEELKRLDMKALEMEHLAFQQGDFGPLLRTLKEHDLLMDKPAWSPELAEMIFLTSFAQYFEKPETEE